MNQNHKIRSLIIGCIAAIIFLLIGAVATAIITASNPSNTPRIALVITGTSGGMCPNGPCGGDNATLYSDGAYGSSKVSPKDLGKLRAMIDQFDSSTYDAQGDCGNSIVDGSDPYLKFPQKYGDRTFEPCGLAQKKNPLTDILTVLANYKD